MAWHKAIYIMTYAQNGEKTQHKIYAQSLKEAKYKAREIAEKNGIGIMYGLELEQSVYRY